MPERRRIGQMIDDASLLLVIRSSGSLRERHYRDLKSKGFQLWCFDYQVKEERFPSISKWIECDFSRPCNLVAKDIVEHCLDRKPDGILSFDEFGVEVASLVSEILGLPGISSHLSRICRNKFEFRSFCKSHGLPCVNYSYANSVDEVKDLKLTFPVVMKPVSGAGSHFVNKADSMTELIAVYENSMSLVSGPLEPAWEWAHLKDRNMFFFEEYIDGSEIDIDVLVQNGRLIHSCISDNFGTSEPSFLELGGCTPSFLPDAIQLEVVHVIERIFDSFKTQFDVCISGCFHVEAKVNSRGQIIPIEINCRLGGAETWLRAYTTYGVDLAYAAAMLCMGRTPSILSFGTGHRPLVYSCSINLVPSHSGIITHFKIPELVLQHSGFAGSNIYSIVGDVVKVPPDGYQYLGWFLYQGVSSQDAFSNARMLHSMLEISVKNSQGTIGTTILPREFEDQHPVARY